MWPIRTNFYNENISMIHEEKLLSIMDKIKEASLRKYIRGLIEKYNWERFYLDGISSELKEWPNCYIGFSRDDKKNSLIIDLAMQDSMNDTLGLMDIDYLIYACGVAFIQENYELANELSKINSLLSSSPSSSVSIREILQVSTKDTLNYLLTYIQTKNKVTNDKMVVFYNRKKYVTQDTTSIPSNNINTNPYILKLTNK